MTLSMGGGGPVRKAEALGGAEGWSKEGAVENFMMIQYKRTAG